jgi:uncharacterized protein YvpB
MNYSLILDWCGKYQGAVDATELKRGGVVGVLLGLNSKDLTKDPLFDQQWAEMTQFVRAPYFVYRPEFQGKENFDFLVTVNETKCPTVFIDIEVIRVNLPPNAYSIEFNAFINLCRAKWHTVIYTGSWFLENITTWPKDLDYWWSAYPANMCPAVPQNVTWSQLQVSTDALPWPPRNYKVCPGVIKLWQCSGNKLIVPGSPKPMDISIFPGTPEQYKAWIEGETMNVLPVPYISQIRLGAFYHANDCGAASTLMVLQAYQLFKDKTVDWTYDMIQPSGDIALSAIGLQALLAANKISNKWVGDMKIHDLYDPLSADCPIIALIHYAPLVKASLTEKTGFLGAHFVVVIGMDIKFVYIHDPYSINLGESLPVPVAVFEQAWAQASLDGNPDHAAIVTTIPIQDLSTPESQPPVIKYMLNVNGLNVRTVPGGTGSVTLVRTLWRDSTPLVTIVKISGDWGQLADYSGWVYMLYLKIN